MLLSIPLTGVKDVTGQSFPINLSYKAGIKTSQSASSAGLGFEDGIGAIIYKTVMVPDFETSVTRSAPAPGCRLGQRNGRIVNIM
jgi:hypothetical protein